MSRPGVQAQGGVQTSRNDIYLPPMPEMVQRQTPAAAGGSPRYASSDDRSSRPKSPAGAAIVRGQGADEALPVSPAQFQLPTPEQMGLLPAKDAKRERPSARRPETGSTSRLDWPAARRRLDGVGALSFRLEKSAAGGFRFTCVLPHPSDPSRERHFEAQADTEAEAVELVLRQAEQWKSGEPSGNWP